MLCFIAFTITTFVHQLKSTIVCRAKGKETGHSLIVQQVHFPYISI